MSSLLERPRQPPAAAANAARPVWVWVITIFYTFSIGLTLLSFAMVLSGAGPSAQARQAYLATLGPLEYLAPIGLWLLTILATVLLFLLRKAAAPLFAAILFLNICVPLLHAVTTSWTEAFGGRGFAFSMIGQGILGAVALYSRHLSHVGVLK